MYFIKSKFEILMCENDEKQKHKSDDVFHKWLPRVVETQ